MDTVSQYEGVQKNQLVDVVPQMVVDSIGKENSKFDIVIQLYFFHKLGYCNIPLWHTETTYSLRTLARK